MYKKKSKRKRTYKLSFKDRVKLRTKKVYNALFEEIDDNVNSSFTIFEVMLIIVISIVFGMVVGYLVTYHKYQIGDSAKVAEIIRTYEEIRNEYNDDVSDDDLANAAIKGMVSVLNDPYSSYMDSKTSEAFNEIVDGEFVGIGVSIIFDTEANYNRVYSVYDSSPAKKVGMQEGDLIIEVNGVDVAGKMGDDMTSLIKGKEGSEVELTIKRGEELIKFSLKRSSIELKSVSDDVMDYEGSNIGYIRITSFAANTFSQFKKSLKKVEDKKIDGLVLDLRDNPGGHLEQARKMLELFFKKKVVLYQTEEKGKKTKILSTTKESRDYPVVILVNHGSASASEVMAASFKDNYKKVKIVGLPTYGKGTIQKSTNLSTGSSIKYTTQKWLTPKGKWLDEKGIEPDVAVDLNEEFYNNPIVENDPQIKEALKTIKESYLS